MPAISASLWRRVVPLLGFTAIALVAGLTFRAGAVGRPVTAELPRPIAARASEELRPHEAATVHYDLLSKLLADDRRSAPADEWLRGPPNTSLRVATQSHPLLNRAAPEFTLEDHEGKAWQLHDPTRRGPLILVFYLGYSCNACVHGLCELNADLDRFRSLGAAVAAISGDKPESTRQRFEQYGRFDFPVLFDPEHRVASSYGTFLPAENGAPEELLHATFVIGADGELSWAHRDDAPFRNNMALLYEAARLAQRLPEAETIHAVERAEVAKP
jgi:peroxiredoxin